VKSKPGAQSVYDELGVELLDNKDFLACIACGDTSWELIVTDKTNVPFRVEKLRCRGCGEEIAALSIIN